MSSPWQSARRVSSESMRILIIDDSERLREALARGLRALGHTVDVAEDGAPGLALLASFSFDLVVLDLMMPGTDGATVLRSIRSRKSPVRVLVLSARDQVRDRVAALDFGADDYLVKPFSFDELRARIEALGRRPVGDTTEVLQAGNLQLDASRRIVRCNGRALSLTPKEYGVLEMLLRGRGRVFSRQQIFDALYESTARASDRVIEVLISTLRSKLGESGCADVIQTRRGFGYVID